MTSSTSTPIVPIEVLRFLPCPDPCIRNLHHHNDHGMNTPRAGHADSAAPPAPPPTRKPSQSTLLRQDAQACSSPDRIMRHLNQQIEEQLSLAVAKIDLQRPHASPMHIAATRSTATRLNPSPSFEKPAQRITGLRRVATRKREDDDDDDDDATLIGTNPSSTRCSDAESFTSGRPSKRRVTIPNDVVRERNTSSSSQSIRKHSVPSSPIFNMFRNRSTIHVVNVSQTYIEIGTENSHFKSRPATPSRFRSPSQTSCISQCRPPITGRQISSPISTTSSANPTLAASPPSFAPSKLQSWPGSYCASRTSPHPPVNEDKSCWSDSEDDGSSKKILLGKSRGRRRRFRGRLSETFAFLSCGS